MLELRGVSKSFAGVPALRTTNLTLEQGHTTVLLGPSGCGKSTLLRLIIGLVGPDSGEVRFDGTAVTPATVLQLRRRMGYVIQEGGLLPHLSAFDNVALMARHLRWPRQRLDRRITELAELTHLPVETLQRFPAQLSGGQRQRVSLMRSLTLDPEVLLLDEPLGALDPMIRADLQRDLADIFKRLGKTVVLVTHDLAEAAFFADHVVLMRDGDIVQTGTTAALLHDPADAFVERFVSAQRGAWAALSDGGT